MSPVAARHRLIDLNVPGWLAARRYGVPAAMVEQATQRRLAGDWRGACAAARVDVRFSLDDVRRRHGTEVAAQLSDDLCHLAPDLVRWHAPRHINGGLGLLAEGRSFVLAEYGEPTSAVRLVMRSPAHHERPQRLVLDVLASAPDPSPIRPAGSVEDWTAVRDLWDVRASDGLRRRLGGGDRTPFFHRDGRPLTEAELAAADDPVALTERVMLLQDAGEFEAAWHAAGILADFTLPGVFSGENHPLVVMSETLAALVPALARAARAWFARPSASPRLILLPEYGWVPAYLIVEQRGSDLLAYRSTSHHDSQELPALPRPLWQRFPDLEMLRTGRITLEQLHPLVRAALFPDAPETDYRPVPMPTVDTADVRVRCRGRWHRIGWRDGRLALLDHTDEEGAREQVMLALGAAVPACFAVGEAWPGRRPGRLPKALRRLRSHALHVVMHGRGDELHRLLDAGIDPAGLRDRWAGNLLHHLAKLDDPLPFLPRLLAAGLDINERNQRSRTPLVSVLFDGGPATLVRAMLEAGADPTVVDDMGNSTLHLLRTADADLIVPWLVAAGVSLEGYNEDGRTPLMAQILAMAPPATIRAMLAAGADLTRRDKWDYDSVLDVVALAQRTDLDFLVDAALARKVTWHMKTMRFDARSETP